MLLYVLFDTYTKRQWATFFKEGGSVTLYRRRECACQHGGDLLYMLVLFLADF